MKLVAHIIVGLEIGGAELMLKRLISTGKQHSEYRHCVISLSGVGEIGAGLRQAGIGVYALQMTSPIAFPMAAWRLVRLLRTLRPAIVQTWMYHADFIGGLVARLLGCKVVWGVRSTAIPQGPMSLTWWLIRLNAFFSSFVPHKIICCAVSAQNAHAHLGYAAAKMLVIPNGYDFSRLSPDQDQREALRNQLGFKRSQLVIGAVGRFDALKDFPNFIRAAKVVTQKRPDARFLMVGRGLGWDNTSLRECIAAEGLSDKFHLVGERADIRSYLAGMDIFCLSSKQEAFPNVVVEAMAMGLPCVVTRAGDAAAILEGYGRVVPVQDSSALGCALVEVCELSVAERRFMGATGAALVRGKYDIDFIRRRYEATYDEILHPSNSNRTQKNA